MTRQTIPILTCFDDCYVIPAAVAFLTLAEQADPAHRYVVHVAHSGLTPAHQARLQETVAGRGAEVSLVFVDLQDRLCELFARTGCKGHYSKEMFYKLLAPSLFPEHDKMLVTDVDVLFQGDVSRDYLAFDTASDVYVSGSPSLVRRGSWVHRVADQYADRFTADERARLRIGAGYYLANLARMRRDGLEAKLLAYADAHADRLLQPEQDVLNLVCHPGVALLPADSMVCSYAYDHYLTEADLAEDVNYPPEAVRQALAHPVQLHYAGRDKPWNAPEVTKADLWYAALARTGFLADQLQALGARLAPLRQQKVVATVRMPLTRRRFVLTKTKA